MDKAEVKISRRGSVSIHIPSNVSATPDEKSYASIPLATELSYRERARAAIEATLSPGSEFSFGDASSRSHSSGGGISGNSNASSGHSNHSYGQSFGTSGASGASGVGRWQQSNINRTATSNVSAAAAAPPTPHPTAPTPFSTASTSSFVAPAAAASALPRSSTAIRYMRGVGPSTVTALDRLEDTLARTASLSGSWAHQGPGNTDEEQVEHAAIREISYLRSMQNQLASASSQLLHRNNASTIIPPATATATATATANKWPTSLPTQQSTLSPAQIKLDQTLSRLHQAATREGVLRMENLRLRQQQAEHHIRGNINNRPTKSPKKTTANTPQPTTASFERLLSGSNANVPTTTEEVWLRCATLEEKNAHAEKRIQMAEATAEALAHQLRKIRQGKATSALTSEAELYRRIDHGLNAVEQVAAPLVALERKATERHEAIASQLATIDVQVRRETATLEARVNDLEKKNSELKYALSGRPTKKEHMHVLRRECGLMKEIARLRVENATFQTKNKKPNKNKNSKNPTQQKPTVVEGKERMEGKEGTNEGKEGKEGNTNRTRYVPSSSDDSDESDDEIEIIVSDEDSSDGDAMNDKNAAIATTTDQISMRVDRILSNVNVLELSNCLASLDQYSASSSSSVHAAYSVPLSTEAVRVGWASTCLVMKLMKQYNIQDATQINAVVSDMDCNASAYLGLQECLQTIQTMVDAQDTLHIGTDAQRLEKKENTEQKDDNKETVAQLGNVAPSQPLTALDGLTNRIQILLNERRILAFEQTQPEKVLHEVLLHFQMIVKAETLHDVVPRMEEIMTRLKLDRTALDQLRNVFGLRAIGNDLHIAETENKELIEVIRAYAVKEGLTNGATSNEEKKRRNVTFVPTRKVRRGQF